MVVKIADFGLARDIYSSDYYKVSDKRRPMPIKWVAIESLEDNIFSTKTDVVRTCALKKLGIFHSPNL